MDLLILSEHGVFRQRLEMLPAAQRADFAQFAVMHRQVTPVALAEHRAFHMGGFQLAAFGDGAAIGTYDPLAHIQAAAVAFGVPKGHHDLVVARSAGKAFGLW